VLYIKSSVRLTEAQAMAAIMMAAVSAYDVEQSHAVITSAIDSKHGRGSLHYVGHALDFRTKAAGVKPLKADRIVANMKAMLGPDFDVLNEGDHIHVEWQPKGAVN